MMKKVKNKDILTVSKATIAHDDSIQSITRHRVKCCHSRLTLQGRGKTYDIDIQPE